MKSILETTLLLFTFSVCSSQIDKNVHDTDTTLITYSSLQSSPIFQTNTFTYGKQMRVWFAMINDTKETLFIDRIITSGGTVANCGKKSCSLFQLPKGDTLMFCLYCDSNRPGKQLRNVTIARYREKENPGVSFKVMTYARN